MTQPSPDDAERLKTYLGNSRFGYVDFQEAEAVASALQRWPLLRRLLESSPDSGTVPAER
jgi:hypothetical protein